MYKIQIDDVIRNATPEEIEEIEIVKNEFAIRNAEIAAKEQAKNIALEKLAALGLTVEDLKALGLG